MNRTTKLILAIVFLSLQALGAPPANWPFGSADASEDYFSKVEALFNASDATLPAREELSGWWNGRCFHHQDRQKPMGGLLVAQDLGSELGPLFPSTKAGKIVLLVHQTNPTGFDLVSRDAEAESKKWLEDNGHRVTRTATRNRALASMYLSVNGTPVDWQVRRLMRDGKLYYVMLSSQLIDTSGGKEGDTMFACYFFEKAKLESKP